MISVMHKKGTANQIAVPFYPDKNKDQSKNSALF